MIDPEHELAPRERRSWTSVHYVALWFAMAQCVPTYALTAPLLREGLAWWQALGLIAAGNLVSVVPLVLIGYAGVRYGVSFPVLCRSAFGPRGSHLPALLRALIGCLWFGIQCWIGGTALNRLMVAAFPAWGTNADGEMGCCFVFWVLNVAVLWSGLRALTVLLWVATPTVLLATLALLHDVSSHGMGPIFSQAGQLPPLPELALLLTAQISYWSTVALSIPDFTRLARSATGPLLAQALSLPLATTLFAALGMAITSAASVTVGSLVWDPSVLLSQHPSTLALSALVLVLATLAVNIPANLVGAAFALKNLWPDAIELPVGATIAAVLGVLMQPWFLLEQSGRSIQTFLVGYSALLGPIAGIVICDFWWVRRGRLDVDALYRPGPANPRAMLALLAGVIPSLPGFCMAVAAARAGSPAPSGTIWSDLYALAWFIGFTLSFGIFAALTRRR